MIYRHTWFLKDEWTSDIPNIDSIDETSNNDLFITEVKKIINLHMTCVSNGTSALYLGMKAIGLTAGDEIIIPPFSYPSLSRCSKAMNLKIKYCDIDKKTFCMNPEYLKNIISKDTKAVGFINHLGYVGEDLIKIKTLCDENGILLFEDSAQGFGQFYNGKMCGTFGEFGITSFSGSKLISAGGGGIIYSKNKKIIDRIVEYKTIENINSIGNYCMPALLAHVLTKQLKDIDYIISHKKRIHEMYTKYIDINVPFIADKFIGFNSIAYTSKCARDICIELYHNNIKSRYKFYPAVASYNNAESLFESYIELPQDISITLPDIKKICGIIKMVEFKHGILS